MVLASTVNTPCSFVVNGEPPVRHDDIIGTSRLVCNGEPPCAIMTPWVYYEWGASVVLGFCWVFSKMLPDRIFDAWTSLYCMIKQWCLANQKNGSRSSRQRVKTIVLLRKTAQWYKSIGFCTCKPVTHPKGEIQSDGVALRADGPTFRHLIISFKHLKFFYFEKYIQISKHFNF